MEARTVVLKAPLDEGMPGPEHFDITSSQVADKCDKPGQVLLQVLAMSADPYLRGRIKSSSGAKEKQTMSGFVTAQVLDSTDEKHKVGALVGANLPFSTVQLVDTSKAMLWPLPSLPLDKASLGIGVLGMPGSTAYGGLVGVLRPKKGDTLWVSAAAGAVGSVVGMLAKNVFGCKVIGSAGGPEKCKMVVDRFGFDHCVDYKKAGDDAAKLEAMLREVAPDGIDMYFENVGGIHFTVAAKMLRQHGRIAVCGAISQYNNKDYKPDQFSVANMIYNFHRIEGFVCQPWLTGKVGKFHSEMPQWVAEGKVLVEETKFEGVDQWPTAFRSLFEGSNKGKVVVTIAPQKQLAVPAGDANPEAAAAAAPDAPDSKRASKRSSKRSSTKRQ